MIATIRTLVFLSLGLMFLTTVAKAQVQVMPAVSVLVADGNTVGVGSVSGRYVASSHIATGINIRYVPATKLLLATLEADYFVNIAKSTRPFIGLEAGVFSEYHTGFVSTTRGVVPKIGVQRKLSNSMGIQVDIGYPIAIHQGERFGEDSGLLIGVGLSFSLGADR